MKRIARWEVLPPMFEACEHANAERWIELGHLGEPNGKDFVVRIAARVPCRLNATSVVDAVEHVIATEIAPLRRQGLRVERVV